MGNITFSAQILDIMLFTIFITKHSYLKTFMNNDQNVSLISQMIGTQFFFKSKNKFCF